MLVDEYDKPILDALVDAPEVARANRDYLRGLYGVIKDSDAHVRFTFLTGVSKFSKVSVFSVLNNLTDLTLDRRYSSICGYTERDLDTVFAPELAGLDRERVREWYNGYRWRGEEKVYNPYDVLLLFDRREFAAHWFETGTPAFLVDTLFERRLSSVSLDRTVSTGELLSEFDVNRIGTEALLFQTGYLTITGEEELGGEPLYRLGYPNREVRQSLNRILLRHLVQDAERQTANSMRLSRLLAAHDCAGLEELFQAFFASIPDEWHTSNDIANYEGYYASVFYSYFAALGYDRREPRQSGSVSPVLAIVVSAIPDDDPMSWHRAGRLPAAQTLEEVGLADARGGGFCDDVVGQLGEARHAGESGRQLDPARGQQRPRQTGAPFRPAGRPAPAALRAQQRVVVRPGAFPLAEHRADSLQHRARACRERLLVQRRVDLRRRPAGKRPARRRLPVHAVFQQVDGQPGTAAARAARRACLRNFDPQLRKPPRLVPLELAPARVGGVVHFQHHVREVVLADRQHRHRQPGARRVQVHHLVGLHDEARLVAGVALGEVGAAEALHRRPAHLGDERGQPPQATCGALVAGTDRIADPGGLGSGVPVFEAHLAVVEFLPRQTDRFASREVRRRRRLGTRRGLDRRTERAHGSHAGNERHRDR